MISLNQSWNILAQNLLSFEVMNEWLLLTHFKDIVFNLENEYKFKSNSKCITSIDR